MQRWISRSAQLLLLQSLLVLAGWSQAYAQVRFVPESLPAALVDLLNHGQSLETERRWGEALSHYENALREHPGQRVLEERLDLAKLHFDLSRRYGDRSYCDALTTLSGPEALDLYGEVLVKIGSHYVATPEWQRMVYRGTASLEVALGDRNFRRQNLPNADEQAIDGFRTELRRVLAATSIPTRIEAQRAVAMTCKLAEERLGLSSTAVALEYISGAAGGLDDYSAYLTADQLRDVYSQIDGNFVGLGIELKAANGALLLVNVITGSPAARAGIRAGDTILSVDGHSTASMTTDQAAVQLQGEEGSVVEVVVSTAGQSPRKLRVRREHVEVPSVEGTTMLDKAQGIGYFRLTSFQKTTVRDVDAALWDLHRQGMRSLILDLRGNPGGLLTSSVEVADRFLERGGIVSTRGRNPQEDFKYSAHYAGTWQLPLVVLIDGDSASASEIFAGAIRDNQRGTIVGARSFGKGSVQGIFPLNHGGAGIRLTTAKFYSPSGKPISKVGVQPDVVVREAARPIDGQVATQAVARSGAPKDLALDAALESARHAVAAR